jgi:hypothetical protein
MQLISDKLVSIVKEHRDVIIKRWLVFLTADPRTSAYTQKHIEFFREKAEEIIINLGTWISYDTTKEEIGKKYAQEGSEAFKMQVPLCELIRGMYTLRRILWLFVVNECIVDSAFQLHQLIELNNRVILFFDRAEYFLTRGYTEEMSRRVMELWKIKPEEADKIFFFRTFYNR